MTAPAEYTRDYFLTAGETDAQGLMPLPLIVSRLIEVATYHANMLGVGYDALIKLGIGWVLTRVSIVMSRYPYINEHYSITTWIEGYNRLYSDRCFCINDADGNEIGNIRSMWVAIDMHSRTAADLTALDRSHFVLSERRCPVDRISKQPPLGPDAAESTYTFGYTDIDFNRHVNTVQYVRQILNQWSLQWHDNHSIQRFDITFHNECHYDEIVTIRHIDPPGAPSMVEIVDPQGRHAVTAALRWVDKLPH